MTTPPVQVERRIGQRFPYLLSVSFREPGTGVEGLGFTQDVSSRGVFFLTGAALTAGGEIELTLQMPSEITLGDDMRVRCRGRILRVFGPTPVSQNSSAPAQVETKIGVAVRFDRYEYLPELAEPESTFARVTALHPQSEPAKNAVAGRPVQG